MPFIGVNVVIALQRVGHKVVSPWYQTILALPTNGRWRRGQNRPGLFGEVEHLETAPRIRRVATMHKQLMSVVGCCAERHRARHVLHSFPLAFVVTEAINMAQVLSAVATASSYDVQILAVARGSRVMEQGVNPLSPDAPLQVIRIHLEAGLAFVV